jgi:hypothetical protein
VSPVAGAGRVTLGQVVRWGHSVGDLISFHRNLSRYEGDVGEPTFDDGTAARVKVAGPFVHVKSEG